MKRELCTLSVLSVLMFASCGPKETETAQDEVTRRVRVEKVNKSLVSRTMTYSANLESNEVIYLAPTLVGTRIKKINVEVGDRISKGQVLVEMDESSLVQQQLQLKNLELEYNRALRLKETGSISQQNFDQIETQYEVAKTAYNTLAENTKLIAPWNGVVTGKFMEEGELYSGGAFGGASKPSVISIEQINPIKAYVDISEQYYTLVRKGMKVSMTTDVYGKKEFEGTINIVYPTIDPSSRTFRLEILFNNSEGELRPGMYGTIQFNVGEADIITVPSIAVLKVNGSNDRYIFLARDGRAVRVSVKIGQRFEDRVEVIPTDKSINEGDLLISTGQARCVDGVKLEIVED